MIENLVGKRYTRLLVITLSPRRKRRTEARWECLCDCGKTVAIRHSRLLAGHTRSCGCLRRELASKRARIHGKSKTPTYKAWLRIWREHKSEVCSRWRKFSAFLADMGEKPRGSAWSLLRGSSKKKYGPGNCRWAKDVGRYPITVDGVTHYLSEWAAIKGVDRSTLKLRPRKGYPIDKLFVEPYACYFSKGGRDLQEQMVQIL